MIHKKMTVLPVYWPIVEQQHYLVDCSIVEVELKYDSAT